MDKALILNKIQSHYGFSKDVEFAKFLGIPPQNLSKWKTRKTFDVEVLCTNCTDLNPEWLLTGKGEMLKRNAALTDVNVGLEDTVQLLKDLVAAQKVTIATLEKTNSYLFEKIKKYEK